MTEVISSSTLETSHVATDEERINHSLVEKLKFGQDIKADFFVTFYELKFGSDMVKILKLKFGLYFEADAYLRFDFGNNIQGDINSDGTLDILDVIAIVNLVLGDQYNEFADMNYDGMLNVMDVVIVVNSILN